MKLEPWRSRGRRTMFHQPPWLSAGVEVFDLPDGTVIDDMVWVQALNWTMTVAVTSEKLVVMERCYKPGNARVALVLPAGALAEGEDPERGARRELLEETGFAANTWTSLGSYRMDPNYGISTGHLFLAENARSVAEPTAEDLEEIELVLLPLPRVFELLRSGEVATLGSAAAIGLAGAELARPR